MKYLFINVVAGFGSTGRIAADQCRELVSQGHTCVLAYGRMCVGCEDISTVRIGTDMDIKGHGLRGRILDECGFGSAGATRRFLRWVEAYDPDVIWLHNLHGYFIHVGLLFSYLRSCGKKVLWTLHDCWAFTGHCAYFDFVQCDRWKTGCHDCPQRGSYPASLLLDNSRKNYDRKKALFTGIPHLSLVVPSFWLKHRVEQSFLRDYPVDVVYNSVNTSIFHPTYGDFRMKHGLEDKKIILGVASVWDARKGLSDFVKLSNLLDDRYQIVLIGLTRKQIDELPKGILGLPRTDSAVMLAQAYTAADIYVNPSTEETFGMTTLEARCCGTEAVVYTDTACEEIVNQFGGIAVPRGAENLRDAIVGLTREGKHEAIPISE